MAEWVARQTAEQEVGGSNPGIPPLLKHACGGRRLAAMLAVYTGRGVAPEVNLRDKWTCVQQKFKKKKKKKKFYFANELFC